LSSPSVKYQDGSYRNATVCSVFKTVKLGAFKKTRDSRWNDVNSTKWSIIERSVSILIASLLPLQKKSSISCFAGFSHQCSQKPYSKTKGQSLIEDDGDSEQDTLSRTFNSTVIKTVVHEVTSTE
jgi:hypothetical protein